MPVLHRISELLGAVFWGPPQVARIALGSEHSPIYSLPPEIFVLIANYLSVEAGASLSLTCYALYSCLGKQCLEPLKEVEYSIMNRFLHLLERDLPTHVICPHCNRLHSMIFAKKYYLPSARGAITSKPCGLADSESWLDMGLSKAFSPTIFRMAMKAYRHGQETAKLLDLLSYRTERIPNTGFVELQTAVVRIQDGSLLEREQRVFMVPSSQKIPVPCFCILRICSHIKLYGRKTLYKYGIQIPLANEIEEYKNKQGLIRCEYCYTEFRIDFKSYGKAGNAMFATRWIDVGEGRDINDYKFTSRLRGTVATSWKKIPFRRGSICTAFEQMAESKLKFDSLLTRQNEMLLRWPSPWPGPDDQEFLESDVKQSYVVSHGRLLSLSEEGTIL